MQHSEKCKCLKPTPAGQRASSDDQDCHTGGQCSSTSTNPNPGEVQDFAGSGGGGLPCKFVQGAFSSELVKVSLQPASTRNLPLENRKVIISHQDLAIFLLLVVVTLAGQKHAQLLQGKPSLSG